MRKSVLFFDSDNTVTLVRTDDRDTSSSFRAALCPSSRSIPPVFFARVGEERHPVSGRSVQRVGVADHQSARMCWQRVHALHVVEDSRVAQRASNLVGLHTPKSSTTLIRSRSCSITLSNSAYAIMVTVCQTQFSVFHQIETVVFGQVGGQSLRPNFWSQA